MPKEISEIKIPKFMANFRGLSEKESIISEASFTLFLNVYEGLPENLVPWSAKIWVWLNPSHLIVLP